jgi:hypothetical protein
VQTVQGALSRARVYGHRGRVLAGAAINGGIDIRT